MHVRVEASALASLQAHPDQLGAIVDAEAFDPQLGIADADIFDGIDYRAAASYCEQRGAPPGDDDDHDGVPRDLGADGTLGFGVGHGLAFSASPDRVERASAARRTTGDIDVLRSHVLRGAQ